MFPTTAACRGAEVKRRAFLQGISVASAAPLVPTAATADAPDVATDPLCTPQPAVFQQQVYFSFDGSGAAYTPPAANSSTVAYRAGLSEEEFLRRHWFS